MDEKQVLIRFQSESSVLKISPALCSVMWRYVDEKDVMCVLVEASFSKSLWRSVVRKHFIRYQSESPFFSFFFFNFCGVMWAENI